MFAHLRHDGEPLPDGGLKGGEETAEAGFALRIGRSRIENGDAQFQGFGQQGLRLVLVRRRTLGDTPRAADREQAKAELEAGFGECRAACDLPGRLRMKIGLPPEDPFREEPESLDDGAGRNIDMASDARTFQNAAALVRLRMAKGPAIPKVQFWQRMGPRICAPRPIRLDRVSDPPPRRRAPSPISINIPRPSLEGEAAFLADLGIGSDLDRSAGGNKPASREKLRVIADDDGPIVSNLKDDAGPEDHSLSKLDAW